MADFNKENKPSEKSDEQSLDNFSITNTMEMGMGNQELLNDLMETETSTTNPDEVIPIIKDVKEDEIKKPLDKPKGKEIVPKEEGKEISPAEDIINFLGDSENSEEGEEGEEGKEKDTKIPVPKTKEEIAAGEEGEEGEEGEPTQFSALASDLKNLGVFTTDEGEEEVAINTPEEFLERFTAEKKKGAIEIVDNFIGQFGEDYQEAFNAIFVKGVEPKEYFNTFNNIKGFADLDISIEDNQVSVLKQALTEQGFESEDVTAEIERLRSYGDLETVAERHHKVLIKKESAKLKQMEVDSEKQLQAKNTIKNQYITNVQNIIQEKLKDKSFDGIPINPKLANELQDFLLVDKYKTTSGETLTDFDKAILEMKRPENHASKVKIALLLKIMEKDPNLSTIQRVGITKKSNQLFSEVARQVSKIKTPSQNKNKTNSWFTK